MLSHHLQKALSDLRDIIKITESDIKNIKQAEHDTQFDRLSLKEEKLKSFEAKKTEVLKKCKWCEFTLMCGRGKYL